MEFAGPTFWQFSTRRSLESRLLRYSPHFSLTDRTFWNQDNGSGAILKS
jgi:hypothetical protein